MKAPQLTRYLILLVSTNLTYFGLGTLINLGSHPELMGVFIFYDFAMFIESAVLLFCYFRLKTKKQKDLLADRHHPCFEYHPCYLRSNRLH